jgi:hypothetical protein
MRPFSQELNTWLHSKQPKTIGSLSQVMGEKSYAIVFLVLMAVPALPLPTGGITHIFEIITMLLALEMIIGRQTLWLPKKWLQLSLGEGILRKTLPRLIRIIAWLEKYARPRFKTALDSATGRRFLGLIVLILALTAFLAPPFSGLDTVPALGVVAVSLGIILGDVVFVLIGIVLGAAGIALDIVLGGAAVSLLHHLWAR